MTEATSHYEVLGVTPTATADQLRAAYRRLAREHHPDTGRVPDAGRMATVNVAWTTLSDPGRRAQYDLTLRPRPSGRPAASQGAAFSDRSAATWSSFAPDVHGASRRWPALSVMLLVVMAAIFVVTAYALRPASKSTLDPNRPLEPGRCVVIRPGPYAVGASCDGPHYGQVSAVVGRAASCPPRTEGYFDRANENLVCVRVG